MAARARRSDESYEQYRENLKSEARVDKDLARGGLNVTVNAGRRARLRALRSGYARKGGKVEVEVNQTTKPEDKKEE